VLYIFAETDPVSQSAYLSLEYLTNALHQQGKTQEALLKLKEYKSKIERLPDSSQTVQKLLLRTAVLLFIIDKFEETLSCLKEVIKYSEEKNLTITLQTYCELATVHWELGNEKEARAVQDKMKSIPIKDLLFEAAPVTRSKYLCTLGWSRISVNEFKIDMRVNRTLPRRKEGDVLEENEAMIRKLKRCFLEISFEVNGRIITLSQMVTTPHQFEIHFPIETLESSRWYEVVVDIYSNEKKVNKLGIHHQLVYVHLTEDDAKLTSTLDIPEKAHKKNKIKN